MLYAVVLKRVMDVLGAMLGLATFGWLIPVCWLIASVETRGNGFFIQRRIGRYGKPFKLIKIKTMHHDKDGNRPTITLATMDCFSRSGRWMRRLKLDEIPQLWNVLMGDMSLVGPRPDVPGYADKLQGDARVILELRPGLTGPATIKYKNEEEILARAQNSRRYNDEVIWPDKVRLNVAYYHRLSLRLDLYYLVKTIKG